MPRKRLTPFWVPGLVLLLFLLHPLNLRAQVGCNGRCLFLNDQPKCSLSLFGANICFHGQDYCAEFACPGSTTEQVPPAALASVTAGIESMDTPSMAPTPEKVESQPRLEGPMRVNVLKDRS